MTTKVATKIKVPFSSLKAAVALNFNNLQEHPLFRVDVAGEELWELYLASFPEGSNLKFRERAEHDCSACRSFIKAMGNVVGVLDGEVRSIWDIEAEEPYRTVAERLSVLVKSKPISDAFLSESRSVGVDKNFEKVLENVATWEHLSVHLDNKFVAKKDQIPTKLGEIRSTHAVLLRSLTEIDLDSVDAVLELIAQNSLYRGEENKFVLESFRKLKLACFGMTEQHRAVFSWLAALSEPASVTKIRSTAIGTLLVDLAEGKDLDQAVGSFEAKVAPTNYRRPTALVTKAMIERAKKEVEALGLTSSLERRFATARDLTVNDVLFTNKTPATAVSGGVFDELVGKASAKIKDLKRVEEITIDKFIVDVLPLATSVEVLLENRSAGNMVSLVGPSDPTAPGLFKWGNKYSWSYAGEMADSIKERVKKAGGSVEGDVCIRLAWHNFDDLDLHMIESGGYELYFRTRDIPSPGGGRLDVDMNAGGGHTREPVENIFYSNRSFMKRGTYTVFVHNYAARETTNVGFEIEADLLGDSLSMSYDKAVKNNERVDVLQFTYDGSAITVVSSLPASTATKMLWGLPTQTFHRVSTLLLSPNHWGDHGVGNRHYLFVLEGCKNDGTARGFFNEFLRDDLKDHRKVLELVGSKLKLADSPDQLSGLGFSSTQRNSVVCRVQGSFSRTLKVLF